MQEVFNFFLVLFVAVFIASLIGTMYASGLRLWARSAAAENAGQSYLGTRVASVACFAACVVVVLFALWLMIPMFH
ncbi:MAG: hypothetical protein U0O24_01660 [Eggerthellaceae bacterium]